MGHMKFNMGSNGDYRTRQDDILEVDQYQQSRSHFACRCRTPLSTQPDRLDIDRVPTTDPPEHRIVCDLCSELG